VRIGGVAAGKGDFAASVPAAAVVRRARVARVTEANVQRSSSSASSKSWRSPQPVVRGQAPSPRSASRQRPAGCGGSNADSTSSTLTWRAGLASR
jgi:hypothetical protein